jgi:hypothetical protein
MRVGTGFAEIEFSCDTAGQRNRYREIIVGFQLWDEIMDGNQLCRTLLSAVLTILVCSTEGRPATVEELPTIEGKPAIATVGGEPIWLEEFQRALLSSHQQAFAVPGPPLEKLPESGQIDYSQIVDRLVNIRLLLIEAQNMGLDELPELQSAVARQSEDIAIELLMQRQVEDVRPEKSEVEADYRRRVREWKIRSALFKNEAAARKVADRLRDGEDFDTVIGQAAAAGLAEVERQGEYLKNSDLMPAVAQLVSTLEAGEVSPVVPVALKGYIIFQLQGSRYPEELDEDAWKEAGKAVLNRERVASARQFYEDLRRSQAEVDTELLESIDYESPEPEVEALRKDRRVLVEIDGQEPIRVADLTRALENKFFHGFQQAISSKRVNSEKADQLEQILERRLLLREAKRQGLDRTADYRLRVKEYEDALLFGMFVDKVIAPDIRIEEEELKRYYEDNPEAFTAPRMIRIKSLAFQRKGTAIDALEKLSRGTDFEWLAANAEGLAAANVPGRMRFDERLLTERSLPEKLQKAVSGSRLGDYRLYSDPEQGFHYVLRVQQVVDPGPEPYAEVRKDIVEKVYAKKLKDAIEQWSGQLREYYPVKIYLTQPD